MIKDRNDDARLFNFLCEATYRTYDVKLESISTMKKKFHRVKLGLLIMISEHQKGIT